LGEKKGGKDQSIGGPVTRNGERPQKRVLARGRLVAVHKEKKKQRTFWILSQKEREGGDGKGEGPTTD